MAIGTLDLLRDAGADTGVNITGEWMLWPGGPGDFWAWGNLGGGRCYLEAALLETAFLEVCGTSITNVTTVVSAVTKFNFNHGTRIRAIVTGTTSPSSGVFAIVN